MPKAGREGIPGVELGLVPVPDFAVGRHAAKVGDVDPVISSANLSGLRWLGYNVLISVDIEVLNNEFRFPQRSVLFDPVEYAFTKGRGII